MGVERDENLKLRDFPTLNHVVGWITDKVAATQQPAVAPEPELTEQAVAPTSTSSSVPNGRVVAGDLAATDRYPRRVPIPVLRPGLDLCKQTGVALDGKPRRRHAGRRRRGDALVERLAELRLHEPRAQGRHRAPKSWPSSSTAGWPTGR